MTKCFVSINNKENEDAAAEKGTERSGPYFEEDMAYLAHLDRIMDAEDSSEDEARRLYDQHVQQIGRAGRRGDKAHAIFFHGKVDKDMEKGIKAVIQTEGCIRQELLKQLGEHMGGEIENAETASTREQRKETLNAWNSQARDGIEGPGGESRSGRGCKEGPGRQSATEEAGQGSASRT
ncbi:3'-flap-structured DNA binding [Branchiostoma belcheri]|nr:3'-flap-structured DNA binding [Branchiostoma belcheri]